MLSHGDNLVFQIQDIDMIYYEYDYENDLNVVVFLIKVSWDYNIMREAWIAIIS